MFTVFVTLLRGLLPHPGTTRQLVLENLALRHQILVLQRQGRRPRLRSVDRWLWVLLRSCWPDWKAAMLIFRPETVIAKHVPQACIMDLGLEESAQAGG